MKVKIFTLGLLAALAVTSTNSEATDRGARFRVEAKAPQLQAQVQQAHAAHGNIIAVLGAIAGADALAKATNLEAEIEAATDLTTGIGHVNALLGHAGSAHVRALAIQALVQGGADIHTGIGAVNALLGHAGDAHARATAIQALVQGGQPIHTGIGNVDAILGAVPGGDLHAKITNILGRINGLTHAVGGVGIVAGAAADVQAALVRAGA